MLKKVFQSNSAKCLFIDQIAQNKSAMAKTVQIGSIFSQNFRLFGRKIFVKGIPADWDNEKVISRFNCIGDVEEVELFKNQTGE